MRHVLWNSVVYHTIIIITHAHSGILQEDVSQKGAYMATALEERLVTVTMGGLVKSAIRPFASYLMDA